MGRIGTMPSNRASRDRRKRPVIYLRLPGAMQQDCSGGARQKEQRHAQHHTPTFQEREIWWRSVGVNVGHEMDGKNQFYNLPVLIVRKLGIHLKRDTLCHQPLSVMA